MNGWHSYTTRVTHFAGGLALVRRPPPLVIENAGGGGGVRVARRDAGDGLLSNNCFNVFADGLWLSASASSSKLSLSRTIVETLRRADASCGVRPRLLERRCDALMDGGAARGVDITAVRGVDWSERCSV
jgi:hypothetical protein